MGDPELPNIIPTAIKNAVRNFIRPLSVEENKTIDDVIARAQNVKLNGESKKQLDTIKRVFATLSMRASDPAKYKKNMEDYAELLRTDFAMEQQKEQKSMWYRATRTLGRAVGSVAEKTNTFNVYRKAAVTAKATNALNARGAPNATRRQQERDKRWLLLKLSGNVPKTEMNMLNKADINPLRMKTYNEVLGLILVLLAKAENKFQSENSLQWMKQRSMERLKTLKTYVVKQKALADEASWQAIVDKELESARKDESIYRLSKISPDYVFGILAKGDVKKMLDLHNLFNSKIKSAKNPAGLLQNVLTNMGILGVAGTGLASLIAFAPNPFDGGMAVCPPPLSYRPRSNLSSMDQNECIDKTTGMTVRAMTVNAHAPIVDPGTFGNAVKETFTPFFDHVGDVISGLSHTIGGYAGEVLTTTTGAIIGAQTFGVLPAARITYLIISGYQKTGSFKNEFVELHRILFDKRNAAGGMSFDDAVKSGEFTMYNQLSDGEKAALQALKGVYASGDPTPDQIMTYLSSMMKARATTLALAAPKGAEAYARSLVPPENVDAVVAAATVAAAEEGLTPVPGSPVPGDPTVVEENAVEAYYGKSARGAGRKTRKSSSSRTVRSSRPIGPRR